MQNYLQRYVLDGGVMMFFLIPCSFCAVWFMIQGFFNLRRGRVAPALLLKKLREVKPKGKSEEVIKILKIEDSSLAIILRKVLEIGSTVSGEERSEISTDFIDDEITRLYHKNNQLAVIYTVSPLLGLLGTVLGMMRTFYVFSNSAEQSISQLSLGINEALITTMWGLAIAIPSFVVLYIFKQRLFYYEMTLLPRMVKEGWAYLEDMKIPAGDRGGDNGILETKADEV